MDSLESSINLTCRMVPDSERGFDLPWTLGYRRGGSSRRWRFYLELQSLPESAKASALPWITQAPSVLWRELQRASRVWPQKPLITHSSLNPDPKQGPNSPCCFSQLPKKGEAGTGEGNTWPIYTVQSVTGTSSTRPAALEVRSREPLGNPKTLSEVSKTMPTILEY